MANLISTAVFLLFCKKNHDTATAKDTRKVQVEIMPLVSVSISAGKVPDRLHVAEFSDYSSTSLDLQLTLSTPQKLS